MIDRIHRYTPYMWPPSQPPASPGLSNRNILMIRIADFTNRGTAGIANHPDFAGGKLQLGITTIFSDDLGVGPGAAGHLTALAWL
jgi:hypothetical protein